MGCSSPAVCRDKVIKVDFSVKWASYLQVSDRFTVNSFSAVTGSNKLLLCYEVLLTVSWKWYTCKYCTRKSLKMHYLSSGKPCNLVVVWLRKVLENVLKCLYNPAFNCCVFLWSCLLLKYCIHVLLLTYCLCDTVAAILPNLKRTCYVRIDDCRLSFANFSPFVSDNTCGRNLQTLCWTWQKTGKWGSETNNMKFKISNGQPRVTMQR